MVVGRWFITVIVNHSLQHDSITPVSLATTDTCSSVFVEKCEFAKSHHQGLHNYTDF